MINFKILLFVLIGFLYAESSHEQLVGDFKFLSSPKKEIQGYKDFFVFDYKGETLALPVVFRNDHQRKLAYQHQSSPFVVQAVLKDIKLDLDGQVKTAKILHLKRIQKVVLSDFAIKGPLASPKNNQASNYDPDGLKLSQNARLLNPKKRGDVTISGINDTVTNSIIGVGAAYMLFQLIK